MPREEEDSLGQDFTNRPDPGDDRAKGKGSRLGQDLTAGRSASIFDESWSPPEVVAGRYRIEEQVGQGGMGIVYRGHDTQLNRDVAVKFITEGSVGRFRSEARAIARLDHPNIVHVYEIDRQENLHYIVMGFIRGESLAQRLRREGTIPLNEAIEITVCLCEALAHAHGQDVIHRDIKPSNVLLSRDGTPILVDFGIARVNTDDGELTRMGTVLGTVDYMAPEQRQDARLVDARSDLWSLAATLYQMVTGKSPKVIRFNNVPKELQDVLGKALEDEKEDRYQTATEFADALQKAAGVPLPRDPSVSVASLQKGQCFQCGTINENSRKFCEECAAALQVLCMSCEETIRVWEKVCGECGAKQADLLTERQTVMQNQQETAERLKKEHEYEECRAIVQQLAAESDVRLQQSLRWANEFQASLINEARQIVDRGQSHAENKDYDAAIADYTEAIRMDPEYADAYYNRGVAHDEKGECDQAIADYTEAIRIEPDDADTYCSRGRAYSDKGDHDQSITDYIEAIRINPQDAAAYNNRGYSHFARGASNEAIADLTEAIRLRQEFSDAYFTRGQVYGMTKDPTSAIADYTEVIRIEPDSVDAYRFRASCYCDLEDYDSAIADLTEAKQLDSEFEEGALRDAYYRRGLTHYNNKRFEAAIADFTEAIGLNPEPYAYRNRALAHYHKKNYDDAICDFTEAHRLKPNIGSESEYEHAHYQQGLAHFNNKRYEAAIADFTGAIRLNPQSVDAYCRRGLAYFDNKNYESAIADYTEAIRLDPQSVDAYCQRGLAHLENNSYESAKADCTEAIRQDPNRSEAKSLKSELETRQRQLIETRDAAIAKGRQLLEAEDYEGCLQELSKIDESVMLPEIRALDDQARQACERMQTLKTKINDATEKKDLQGLLPLVEEYLQLNRGDLEIQKLRGQLVEQEQKNAARIAKAMEQAQSMRQNCLFAEAHELLSGLPEELSTEETNALSLDCQQLDDLRTRAIQDLGTAMQSQNYRTGLEKASTYRSALQEQDLTDSEFPDKYELCQEALAAQQSRKRRTIIRVLITLLILAGAGLWIRHSMRSATISEGIRQRDWDKVLTLDPQNVEALIGRANNRLSLVPPEIEDARSDLALAELLNPKAPGLQEARDETVQADAISKGIRQQEWDKVLSLDPQNVTALIGRANNRLSLVTPEIDDAQSDLRLAEQLNPYAPGLQEALADARRLVYESRKKSRPPGPFYPSDPPKYRPPETRKPSPTLPRSSDSEINRPHPQETYETRSDWARSQGIKDSDLSITNSIGMVLQLIPPGEFQMGSPESEPGRYDNETQHQVQITKPFYLSAHEVTQQKYQQVMDTNPSYSKGDNKPVTNVSWDDAVVFCRKLSEQEDGEYRLPTEAEWEYACRAGTNTGYSFGGDASRLGQYAWYSRNTGDIGDWYARRVGEKLPNPWGLYDMHGNVWEWCLDWRGPYGKETVVIDPTGPESGSSRVLRGGACSYPPRNLRAAYRNSNQPRLRVFSYGFRVARTYNSSP